MTVPTWVRDGARLRFKAGANNGEGTVEGSPFLVGGVRVVRLRNVVFVDGRKRSTTNCAVALLEEPQPQEPKP